MHHVELNSGTSKSIYTEQVPSLPIKWKAILVILFVLCLCLLVALIVVVINSSKKAKHIEESSKSKSTSSGQCSSPFIQDTSLPKDPTIFQDLSEDELSSVRDFVLDNKNLNVTSYEKATLKDNIIYLIENYLPDKKEVLNYLDKQGPKPTRRARVILLNGAKGTPVIEEYIVEPLPNPTKYSTLKMSRHVDPIPHFYRPWTLKEQAGLAQLYRKATEEAYSILKESFGYWHHNCTDRCLLGLPMGSPGSALPGTRQSWVIFTKNIVGQNLFPVPFQLQIDHKSTDADKWEILQVVYNGQKFPSVSDLVAEYKSGKVKKVKIPVPSKDILTSASLGKRGESMPKTPMRGPTLVEPNGKRYGIKGRKVNYMNWEFHIAVQSSAGPAIYDIRFQGKRIAYEISVQEGAAFYSAFDPKQTSQKYIDTAWGLGFFNMEQIKGIDCPENGVLMDSYHFVDTDKPMRNRDSICVYETSTGLPLRRHRETKFNKKGTAPEGFWFVGGMVDHALVVRVISTPFNYDYIFDYVFHQNGVIEVKTSTTGYVQTTHYSHKEDDFGFYHFPHTIGTIHDHFMLYKVDLDIDGVKNSYQTLDVVAKNQSYFWETGQYRVKKNVVKSTKRTERDALLHYNFDHPKYLLVINENAKNKYNKSKGYRIQPKYMVKNVYPDNYYVTEAAAWAKYQLAITKQKESERFGSGLFNQYDMENPGIHFDDFIKDNENIESEDLVAWVTIGGLHIPNTEDIPVTPIPGNSYTFFLKPFGYFEEDPSMGSTNSMLITKDKDGKIKVDTYGTPEGSTCPIPSRKIEHTYG